MNRQELTNKLQALAFAKVETELFLDTHPDNTEALEYYHKILAELKTVTEEYERTYGPLTAASASTEKWDWISNPWPWHHEANGITHEARRG